MIPIIFTNGCFDIIHPGHIKLFKEASKFGILVVGLNSDKSFEKWKKRKPLFNQEERKEILESIKYINYVIIFDEDTPYKLIKKLKPRMIVKGSEYKIEDVIGHDLVPVTLVEHTGHSSSECLKKCDML